LSDGIEPTVGQVHLERRLSSGGLRRPSPDVHAREEDTMWNDNVELIRTAYEAYARGDVVTMLGFVDPDLEWTYLDPGAWRTRSRGGVTVATKLQEALEHLLQASSSWRST